MDLFEHQAKEIFAEYGVPVPEGKVARTPAEARAIAEAFAAAGKPRVVVKAQVKTGGRGKAGGVKLADGPDDAEEKARFARRFIRLVESAGGLETARQRALDLAQQAEAELDVLPPSPARDALQGSIAYAVERRS